MCFNYSLVYVCFKYITVMSEADLIVQLRTQPFGLLRFGDKLLIGRPWPALKNLATFVKGRNKTYQTFFICEL